jgi:lia operon protein LiaG
MKIIRNLGSFLVVVILSGLAFIFYTEGTAAFSTKVVTIGESHRVNKSDIRELLISSNSTDVTVLPHAGEEVLIDFEGEVSEKLKDAYKLTVKENKKSVEIDLLRTKRTSFTIFAINKGTMLTVKVPEKVYETITIKSKSGDVKASNLEAEVVEIQANSGDIFSKNVTGESSVTVKTSSGDIDFDTSESSLSISGKSNSGEGEIDIPGMLFEEKSENRVVGVLEEGDSALYIKTSSGDYRVY